MNSLFRRILRPSAKLDARWNGFFNHGGPHLDSSIPFRPRLQLRGHRLYSSYPLLPDNYGAKRSILWSFIAANTAVFAGWTYARSQKDFSIAKLLKDNFVVTQQAVQDGRYWTALTSGISHVQPWHFFANMLSFHAFSSPLLFSPAIRAFDYLTIIIGSALGCSIGFLANEKAQGRSYAGALGASGVVMGIGGAAACIAPRTRFLLMGVIPAPLWVLVAGYAAIDTYYLQQWTGVGHAGHLGGLAFGLVFYLLGVKFRPF